ncbi:MAG: flagellar hook-length control protein FliK [Cycloclasticus sp.]|nr:flagellar hook-length control protein FliK [Cycloclasticus sp.]MBQ0789191.1 flagellar hook-length control protein FliK [Cycloclasticus sp.]
MEIPAGLNILPATPSKSGNITLIDRPESSNESSFSNQFDGSVKQLQNNQSKSIKNDNKQGLNENKLGLAVDRETETKPLSTDGIITPSKDVLVTELPKGLEKHVDNAGLLQLAPGVLNAITGISEKRDIDFDPASLSISGNTLPPADELDLQLAEINLDGPYPLPINNGINFNPLGQAAESAAQIASLTAAHFADQKMGINGKSISTDFYAITNAVLADDKPLISQLSDTLLDKIVKPTVEFGLGVIANKGAVLTNVNANAEPLINSMQQLTAATPHTTPVATNLDKPSLLLETPMSNARWGQDFNQRVQWMINQAVSGAEIRLNPQHMGPIEVRVLMQNDQATIAFSAQHGATREAIDAALPRLRELLSEQNVNVVDVDVSQHSFADQRDQQALKNQQGAKESLGVTDEASALFDQVPTDQTRNYTGLFSEFA